MYYSEYVDCRAKYVEEKLRSLYKKIDTDLSTSPLKLRINLLSFEDILKDEYYKNEVIERYKTQGWEHVRIVAGCSDIYGYGEWVYIDFYTPDQTLIQKFLHYYINFSQPILNLIKGKSGT